MLKQTFSEAKEDSVNFVLSLTTINALSTNKLGIVTQMIT